MNGGVCLGAEIDPSRIKKRIETRYCDRITESYHQARDWALEAVKAETPLSIGFVGHAETLLRQLLDDGVIPDVATDQTSAHDPLNGYIPTELSLKAAKQLREEDPKEYEKLSFCSMARHVSILLQMKKRGTVCFDYGNNIRHYAVQGGEAHAFDIPGFVPEYVRPLFCEGKGPFRWVALSGDPEDIYTTDRALIEAFPEDEHLHRWLKAASEKVAFQGLPSRICWLGIGAREKAGVLFNELVASGKVKAPIVIGRDHLDCGSVASPNRETEAMKDGSDAISDWPLLNLMANTAGGATWVSFHHGGGVGMGYSQHAGMVIVCDGSKRAEECLRRVLYNDPALGIIRHADAGYELAQQYAESSL
jgi:urocanate hydratase